MAGCWIGRLDRKSTRLNSSHLVISYAVFCLKKKKNNYSSRHPVRPDQAHRHVVALPCERVSVSPALIAMGYREGWCGLVLFFFFFFLMIRRPPRSPLFPTPTLSR